MLEKNQNDQQLACDVAKEILDYLHERPSASDTLDGIVQWWLIHQRYLRGLRQVEQAIEILMNRNLVKMLRNPDGSVVYSAGSDFIPKESNI